MNGRGRGKRVGRDKERLIGAWSTRKVTGRYHRRGAGKVQVEGEGRGGTEERWT